MSPHIDWIAETVADLPPLATAAEAAKALRTSPRNLRRHVAAGRLKALRAEEAGSSRVLIPRAEIARLGEAVPFRATRRERGATARRRWPPIGRAGGPVAWNSFMPRRRRRSPPLRGAAAP
ncbi:MAG: helix-turn-helix domain-containing protein [Myxococcales bacterium]